jgi:hydroxymethylbilane synthase
LKSPIIIGTRGSELALWQANFIKSELENLGFPSELKIIKTQGDQIQHLSFDKMEGKGFFTKEIEEALLNESIDMAVHSHKDLETKSPEALVVAAVTMRAAVEDILIIRKESVDINKMLHLKEKAVVGTSSSRRKVQMAFHRGDCTTADLRGNVPTRIQKLRDKNYDAILLARAGVERLEIDLSEFEVVILKPEQFVPAPAQGALALQCRAADTELQQVLNNLHDLNTAACVGIERSILSSLNGGCQLPLGVHVSFDGSEYIGHAAYAKNVNEAVNYFSMRKVDPAQVQLHLLGLINTVE